MSSIRSLSRSARLVLAGLVLVLVLAKLVDWSVEYLWYVSLGHSDVFWTLRALSASGFAAGFITGLGYFWVNLWLVHATLRAAPGEAAVASAPMPGLFQAGALALALVAGLLLAAEWDTLLRFVWAQPHGDADPLYGRDIGFYLFVLPLLERVQNALLGVSLLTTALLVWAYGTGGILRFERIGGLRGPGHARWQVIGNGTLLLAALAWGFYLDRFALLYSEAGAVYGAGYTDVHAVRPALGVLVVATLALAVALLAPSVQRRGRTLLAVVGGYLALVLVGLGLVPWGVQGLRVAPNELQVERPYLLHNIELTRQAYAIDHIEERPHPEPTELTYRDLARNRSTVDNIRLWDWGPARRAFRQLQQIRSYYEFNNIDVDRYRLGGDYRQVLLSARELSNTLPGRMDTWVNRHLQYTHGYGLVMSLAAEKTTQGAPPLLVRDLPPRTGSGIRLTEPGLYYGETMAGHRIVDTSVQEFDYPRGDDNVYSSYAGSGGVRLDAAWKRVLFALHRLDPNIALTGYATDESRIQLWRPVAERVRRVAPFLRLDRDPYLVVAGGRLQWIQDAYTVSSSFPYAEPYRDEFNYIRNSVKVVVDAYDGTLTFYVMDPEDPVLRTYRAAFPALFEPLEAMPEALRSHLRYPLRLFQAQVAMYSTYHMSVPQVFYNREDVWAVPWEKFGGERIRMEPYYVLMRLPEEERLEFLLMTPLTPANRDNMIAWVAARSDFPGYGELVVYKLPKEQLILGPTQIEAMIDQDTLISQQLSLWDQRGSRVIRGNLLVIPVEQSFIYVEPVYLIAEGTDLPQLKRIIVSDGDQLAMEPTLDEALEVVFGARPRAPARGGVPPEVLSEARETFRAAQGALREGDWEAFGRAMGELESLLAEPGRSSQSP